MTLAIGARIGCPSPLLRPIRKPLTLARLPAILRPMRFASRTVALLRTALCTHRDLLFEILALRHQLGGLSRSHRRFRTSDRLFWLCLRRVWPGWREALVLVQPATVDRWHREGFSGMVETSLTATVGTTTHRLTTSKPHRAYGDGERSLGRPADPWRIAQARLHSLRTHGVAVCPTDGRDRPRPGGHSSRTTSATSRSTRR